MKLFEPGRIGQLVIKNRIIMAAMNVGPLAEPDGRFSERLIDYYVARARGGTGLVITSSVRVTREIERLPDSPSFTSPMADDIMYVDRFSQLAEAVHDYGGKVAIQLSAALGRNAPPYMLRGAGAVGPSVNPTFFDPGTMSRELTVDEIEGIVKRVEVAAHIVSSSGIDAIEMNFHGGYLFDEFTSAFWNRRKDRYGGDLSGRLRLSLETIEAVKRGAGRDFPLIVKFGLTHYIPGGREIEEGLEMARRWETAGVDALDIDAGSYEVKYWLNPPTTQPAGCLVPLASMVKQAVEIPVIAVGKLGSPELAEKVLQEGKADFIALGRPLLADPDWANKVKQGRLEDIRPCLGEHEGCHLRLHDRKYLSCTVNPATGVEREFALRPAERKKSVLVVGGGPAGMEAARVAALRGHRVALWEKGLVLGGNLVAAAAPEFKQEYRMLINYLSTQIVKLGVEIKLATEATPEAIVRANPEVVFIATGSSPVSPEIPGVDKNNVVTAVDLLLGKRPPGERVAVIGGGIIGGEVALHLARQGKAVTVVEILDSILGDAYWINRMHLVKLLQESNVKTLIGTRVLEITGEGLTVAGKDGKASALAADTVVLATGMKSNNGLVEPLKDKVPELYPVGDCVQPRKVINAIWEAFRAARLV